MTPVDIRDAFEGGQELAYEEAAMLSSPVICHSAAEGYFVAVDLDGPAFLPEGPGSPEVESPARARASSGSFSGAVFQ